MELGTKWRSLPECPVKIRNSQSKLTDEARAFMKGVVAEFDADHFDLSYKYGISRHTAYCVLAQVAAEKRQSQAIDNNFCSRNDTYFTEEYLFNGITYSPDELTGVEKEIYNKLNENL